MKITIVMDIDGEYADGGHSMGVTETGYEKILDLLGQIGTDIDVKRGDVT